MRQAAIPLLSDEAFARITALVYQQSGIVLAAHKKEMVISRLTRRLRELQLPDFNAYCDLVLRDSEEIGFLVNAITTNLTRFFREPHHFEHLRDTCLRPRLSQGSSDKRLRIWSAGCSKGAEAYSIAMVLADCLQSHAGWDAKILATDIDTTMIAHSISGVYRQEEMKTVPAAYRRLIEPSGEQVQMPQSLQSLITFKPLNLLEDWPMRGLFDAIFCRNVVIYFDKPTQRQLFSRLRTYLKPDGFLYVGHSESLAQVSQEFKLIGKTIYRPV